MAKLPAILFCGMALLLLASCAEESPEPAAEAEIAQEADLPIPEAKFEHIDVFGPHPFPREPEESKPGFDPMLVKNIDVVDPDRRGPDRRVYIESLKPEWWLGSNLDEVRRLQHLKAEGKIEDFRAGLENLNETLKSSGKPFEVADITAEEVHVLLVSPTGAPLTIRISLYEEAREEILPREGPKPRKPFEPPGYMPPAEPEPK